MEYTVINDDQVGRFEIFESGQIAYMQYIQKDGVIDLTHTSVPIQLEGQGVGSALADSALNYAREEGLRVKPTCPFITAYVDRHLEFKSLLI